MHTHTFRLLIAAMAVAVVIAVLLVAYLLASAGHPWEAVAVGGGGAFGVVRALFALLGKLSTP